MLNDKKGRSLIVLVLIAVIVIAVGAVAIVLVTNKDDDTSLNNNNILNNSNNDNQILEEENQNVNNENYDELMEMSVIINGNEIVLNKTTIDEFLETSKWTNYTKSDFSTEVSSAIILKDGVNEITLTYLNSNKVIFQATTNEDFDNSVTKIQYKDSYVGTLNIGDNISEQILNQNYTIDTTSYRFYIDRNTDNDLIILYKSNEPIVMNYLYHDTQNNFTGFSAWWFIY